MDLHFNFFNVLILFGGLQGIVLCAYLWFYKKNRQKTLFPFLLFLFSLAFINLYYALMDIDFYAILRALHLFPYPAKWIIGPAIYMYVTCLFDKQKSFFPLRKVHLLFAPAILLSLPYIYWFSIAWIEGSYRIVQVISATNFFRITEVLSILFNLFLLSYLFRWILQQSQEVSMLKKEQSKLFNLKIFVVLVLGIFLFNLILVYVDLITHEGKETRDWYYPLWLSYTLLIYLIGFVGFSQATHLLMPFNLQKFSSPAPSPLMERMTHLMVEHKIFRNPDLRLHDVADQLEVSPKELSQLINTHTRQNFSTLVNHYRIEDVKEKLLSPQYEKFTLLHLANEAGFNSKSSFNEIFKSREGISPSAYRKQKLSESE